MTPAVRAASAALLSLALPGLGHAVAGERAKGAAFFLLVSATFGIGLWLGGRLPVGVPGRPLTWIAEAGSRGAGLLDFVSRRAGLGRGDASSAVADFGDAYLQSAAAMNLLLVVNLLGRPRTAGGA